MSWIKIVNVAFPRNKRILTGRPNVIKTTSTPSGSAPKGTFAINVSNNSIYIYNGTSWVQIG